ncbi:muscle-specific protein [Anaeramoeba ignava]|uniref:Muscle-specific protein n=1 Tax=Anaeramoeba ignava TaxID=1746090 RepID=A0A9Q0RG11_ANAIG|nr:muscle-specific protein [Anaeramoeba ignava]
MNKNLTFKIYSLSQWFQSITQNILNFSINDTKLSQNLCELINKIEPNSIKEIFESPKKNYQSFINSCIKYGVSKEFAFKPIQIINQTEKEPLIKLLFELKKLYQKKKNLKFQENLFLSLNENENENWKKDLDSNLNLNEINEFVPLKQKQYEICSSLIADYFVKGNVKFPVKVIYSSPTNLSENEEQEIDAILYFDRQTIQILIFDEPFFAQKYLVNQQFQILLNTEKENEFLFQIQDKTPILLKCESYIDRYIIYKTFMLFQTYQNPDSFVQIFTKFGGEILEKEKERKLLIKKLFSDGEVLFQNVKVIDKESNIKSVILQLEFDRLCILFETVNTSPFFIHFNQVFQVNPESTNEKNIKIEFGKTEIQNIVYLNCENSSARDLIIGCINEYYNEYQNKVKSGISLSFPTKTPTPTPTNTPNLTTPPPNQESIVHQPFKLDHFKCEIETQNSEFIPAIIHLKNDTLYIETDSDSYSDSYSNFDFSLINPQYPTMIKIPDASSQITLSLKFKNQDKRDQFKNIYNLLKSKYQSLESRFDSHPHFFKAQFYSLQMDKIAVGTIQFYGKTINFQFSNSSISRNIFNSNLFLTYHDPICRLIFNNKKHFVFGFETATMQRIFLLEYKKRKEYQFPQENESQESNEEMKTNEETENQFFVSQKFEVSIVNNERNLIEKATIGITDKNIEIESSTKRPNISFKDENLKIQTMDEYLLIKIKSEFNGDIIFKFENPNDFSKATNLIQKQKLRYTLLSRDTFELETPKPPKLNRSLSPVQTEKPNFAKKEIQTETPSPDFISNENNLIEQTVQKPIYFEHEKYTSLTGYDQSKENIQLDFSILDSKKISNEINQIQKNFSQGSAKFNIIITNEKKNEEISAQFIMMETKFKVIKNDTSVSIIESAYSSQSKVNLHRGKGKFDFVLEFTETNEKITFKVPQLKDNIILWKTFMMLQYYSPSKIRNNRISSSILDEIEEINALIFKFWVNNNAIFNLDTLTKDEKYIPVLLKIDRNQLSIISTNFQPTYISWNDNVIDFYLDSSTHQIIKIQFSGENPESEIYFATKNEIVSELVYRSLFIFKFLCQDQFKKEKIFINKPYNFQIEKIESNPDYFLDFINSLPSFKQYAKFFDRNEPKKTLFDSNSQKSLQIYKSSLSESDEIDKIKQQKESQLMEKIQEKAKILWKKSPIVFQVQVIFNRKLFNGIVKLKKKNLEIRNLIFKTKMIEKWINLKIFADDFDEFTLIFGLKEGKNISVRFESTYDKKLCFSAISQKINQLFGRKI